MGFWIFMLIMSLLLPITMIGFGKHFMKQAPKDINYFFGYRTGMSMKNKDTWEFAHHYCGKIWRKAGWITLIISIIALIFLLGKEIEAIGKFGGALVLLQCIPLLAVIPVTERALRKKFDKYGNRK